MKVGFFVWNPFQIYQFESVAKHLPDSAYILQRRKNIDFQRLFPQAFLDALDTPVHFVTRDELMELDGKYDAIVCQTAFGHMERLSKTKLVGLQYSMSKERHQYGPWRILCDLNLVYGRYSYDRISPYSPCEMIGNPRFDRWFSSEFDQEKTLRIRERLDPAKKTILYMPTWGQLSSMSIFGEAIAELGNTYNVIAKVHHKTDSHELSRKMALTEQGIQDIFGASDDMLHLLREADLVLSDFSGAIFDAINVRKPVILLQQNPEGLADIGAEKFGLESIEYARRHDIGAVVSSPKQLADTVEQVLMGKLDYRESNRQLKQECFAAENDCGSLAAEAIRRLVEHGNIRPHHQIYMRDMLREQRVADEERAKSPFAAIKEGLSAPKKTVAKPAPGVKKSAKSRLNKAVISGVLALYRLAWTPIFWVAEKCIAWSVRRHGQIPNSGIIDLMMVLLPSRQLIFLAQRYDASRNAQAALQLSRKAYQKSKSVGLTMHINFLAKYDQREEMAHLIDELLAHSLQFRARYLQRATRIQDFLGEKAEQIGQARQQVRSFLMQAVKKSKKRAQNIRNLNILVLNRWLDDAQRVAKTAELAPQARARIESAIKRAKGLMGEFYCLTEAANHNYLPQLSANEHLCFYEGKVQRVGDVTTGNIVEFFLPFYFYIETETDPATRQRICAMLRATLDGLVAAGAAIVPRHQFRLGNASPSGLWPIVFSYHTCGNKPGWWHIKDSPLAGYFSMDSQGYSGWSSLGELSEPPAGAKTIPQDAMNKTWAALKDRYVSGGLSKYPQSSGKFSAPKSPYIFLPMQVVNDTVAQLAWIPTLLLAQLLMKLAPEHGYSLVIKRHPKCIDPDVAQFARKYAKHPSVHFTSANIHQILPGASAVVTVNSGVGLEALLHEKLVITTGKSEYGAVTLQARNEAELAERIKAIGNGPDQEQIRRFLCYYVSNYLVSGDDADQIAGKTLRILDDAHTMVSQRA